MAIPSVNAIYPQGGPTASGQVVEIQGVGGGASFDIEGIGVAILDGAATSFTLNWIDGTATLPFSPTAACAIQAGPAQWVASTVYPINYLVLGSAHVQQAQATGKSGSGAAPTWSTAGSTVVDGTGLTAITWKDLGATAAATITIASLTAITNTSATVTLSAAGTNTNALPFYFRIIR